MGSLEGDRSVHSLRILVADDIEANRMLAKAMLVRRGHRVDTAEDGAQALDRVQRERFDLVLMDIDMPVMDGIAATMAIRALAGPVADVPIVAFTSRSDAESKQAATAAGMSDFLSKPLKPSALFAILTTRRLPASLSSSRLDDAHPFSGCGRHVGCGDPANEMTQQANASCRAP
jgi:CheY-like chemotaxis protein